LTTPNDVAILEVLDAAGSGLRAGRVEATGLVLYGRGVLKSGQGLRVMAANGSRARSDDLIDGLFEAVNRNRVRRHAEDWQLTAEGVAVLEEFGARANDAAREVAHGLSVLDDEALADEADRLSLAIAAA
jgi:hypothetical protein